jgi:heme-degrading monooxygenase HmoA
MIVVMNRLTVPAGYGDRLAGMFRERATFSQAPGFIGRHDIGPRLAAPVRACS